jgi:hypothetical protein
MPQGSAHDNDPQLDVTDAEHRLGQRVGGGQLIEPKHRHGYPALG